MITLKERRGPEQGSGFPGSSRRQRWDLLEEYFLGRIPEEVERAVEKEKQAKDRA